MAFILSAHHDAPGHLRVQGAEVRVAARPVEGHGVLVVRVEGPRRWEPAVGARDEMRHVVTSSDSNTARARLAQLYDRLPELDFSRDILQRSPELLRVMTVPACGWSDLGTPRRVVETVRRLRSTSDASAQMPAAAFLDLAAQAVHATA